MPDRQAHGSTVAITAMPSPLPVLMPVDGTATTELADNPETGLRETFSGGEAQHGLAPAPESALTASGLAPPDEPDADDAADVLRAYYRAIDGGDYDGAHRLWSGEGRSSGQTLEQFSAGFAGTTHVSVQPGEAGRIEAGAGARHIEVPVSVTATQDDGSVRRYVGSYGLRRGVVEGAESRWRISSAELRELQP